jgi:hypothetical protein
VIQQLRFLFFCALFALAFDARAYSQFIGYGYSSCLTCHYNSSGGGPLSDYGRGLAATEISGRLFGGTDESLAKQSGFLGSVNLPWWWRPSIGYRGLNLQQSLTRNSQSRFINMQADFTNVFRFDENDKVIAVFNFGYAPTPRNVSKDIPQANKNWISREHYVKVGIGESAQLYAGFMDKAYGIHVPDHEAFSRRNTYNNQNDQVHGAKLFLNLLPVEITFHGFAGNLQQEADLQQKGASTLIEYEVAQNSRIGLTGQYLKNSYMEMIASAFVSRVGVGPGSAILFETGIINLRPVNQIARTGFYTFLQPFLKLARGLNFLTTIEYYTSDVVEDRSRFMRWGPGLQYFPFQRFEFRTEVWNERSFEPENVRADDWTVMSQVHLWL